MRTKPPLLSLTRERRWARRFVAGKLCAHLLEMATIDFVDDFKVTRQQRAEQTARPLFQGLGKQGVVGVGKAMLGDMPGDVPLHTMFVDQQAHQLRHGDGGMSVVHLDGEIAMQFCQRPLLGQLDAQNVLQRAGHEKELLRQA